jgi:hypothetical protein
VKFLLRMASILLVVSFPLHAQNVERQMKQVAHNLDFAVLPVWYNKPGDQVDMQVVGTACLVTPDGYFVTAAHVLQRIQA